MIYTPESQLPIAPQCKPFPLDFSWVILDLKPESQLPIALNVSLSPWTLPWAGADVIGLFLMSSHNTEHPRPMHWPLRESSPKVTSTMVQSRLIVNWCCPESASNIRLEEPHQMAVSANHNLGGHVIQLRSHLIDIIMKNYRGFQGYSPFHFQVINEVFLYKFSYSLYYVHHVKWCMWKGICKWVLT